MALLSHLGVRAVSLDAVVDDLGRRLIENMEGVGWYGMRAAFKELRRTHRRFDSPGRGPLRVTVLGAGAVGGHAIRAATRYGDVACIARLVARNVLGVEVTVLDRDLTWNENVMLDRFEVTDLLVDATQRSDPTCPVVPNPWIEALPQHAVVLDLAADPYAFTPSPPTSRASRACPRATSTTTSFRPTIPSTRAWTRASTRCADGSPCLVTGGRGWSHGLHAGLQPPDRAGAEGDPGDADRERWDPAKGGHFERAVARAELGRWREAHLR